MGRSKKKGISTARKTNNIGGSNHPIRQRRPEEANRRSMGKSREQEQPSWQQGEGKTGRGKDLNKNPTAENDSKRKRGCFRGKTQMEGFGEK